MKIKVLAFGVTKDILGDSIIELQIDESCDVLMLKNLLKNTFPKLPSFIIAVNSEYAQDSQRITDKDEIAIIPPTNGG